MSRIALKILKIIAAIALAISASGTTQALTVRGYGTIIWVPVVVNSSTFTSQIFIHNPQSVSVIYGVNYNGGTGTPNAGANVCPNFTIAANTTNQYSLPTICSNLTFGPSSNYGSLQIYVLQLIAADPPNYPFSVYVRVQSALDHGFSIEGFPVGEIDNTYDVSYVNGVERMAAAPGYTTNCFIGALSEAVTVEYSVESNTGIKIGSTQSVALAAGAFVRIVDVFSAVGAPAGDYFNSRVAFDVPSGDPSYIGFCTVQNDTSFDADFRIAKVFDQGAPNDQSRQFTSIVSVISGTTTDLAGNVIPALDITNQHEWATYMRHPDFVACTVVSTPANQAELRLVDPQGNVVTGDSECEPGYGSFPETNLGVKSSRNSGANGQWLVEVSACTAGPTSYTLTCTGGNGLSTFTYGGTQANQF